MEKKLSPAAPLREWTDFLAAHPDIGALDAFIIDVNGNAVGKRVQVQDAAAVFTDGVQFSACALIADSRGLGHNVQGMGASDGDPDGVALPISQTLCMAPWTHEPVAQVMCHMRDIELRRSFWFDPRVILSDLVGRCSEAGIRPVIACELEFYLLAPQRAADGGVTLAASTHEAGPPRRAANLSMDAVELNAIFLNKISAAAAAQQVPVCGAVAEYGIGQFEVNLRHVSDPLLAADHAVLLKRIVQGVARSMGMQASFMAKPFAHQPGSGLHVHMSLVDEAGANRFGGAAIGAAGGDELLEQAIAGMQALMYDSVGIYAPNLNSHRRFLGQFVPTTLDWGHNNRSVAFRVPSSGPAARRIEHRVAGADASPHLVLATILAAVLHGITHRLTATQPVSGRVGGGGSADFPKGLLAALDRLEKSAALAQYLPGQYLKLYSELKQKEHAVLMAEVFPAEYDFYL
jgi:glutamine synthetase